MRRFSFDGCRAAVLAVALCWLCHSLSACHAATPAILNVKLYNDSTCSAPYFDPSFDLTNFADADVDTNRACVDSSASTAGRWGEITAYCIVTGQNTVIFQVVYFNNRSQCNITNEKYALSLASNNNSPMGACTTLGLNTVVNSTSSTYTGVSGTFSCDFHATSGSPDRYRYPQLTILLSLASILFSYGILSAAATTE